MSLQNLFYIGHCGNFGIEESKEKVPTSPNSMNLYDENMFMYQGAFADLSQTKSIEQAFSGMLTGSHNIKMLTFGLDSIFSASKAFPLSELESLSIFRYLDLASPMAGLFHMPKVLGLSGGAGAPARAAPPPMSSMGGMQH